MKRTIILLACTASATFGAIAQRDAIDKEINRILSAGCKDFEDRDDDKVFRQDLAYTVEKLHSNLNDTTPCAKIILRSLTAVMFNYVDSSNYNVVFLYNLLQARDATATKNYYNHIVNMIRSTVLGKIKLPPSVVQFIGSPEFYKVTTWELPLLITYLNMYEEVENLKKWGGTHSLNELQKEALTVSLVRLDDSATTQNYVAMTPTDSSYWNWEIYITGLNYARTKATTERLIGLLDNKEKVRYAGFCYSDDPQTYYTSVRTLALEKLVSIVEDFPLKEVDVPYETDHFSEASEKDFKTAKRWFKKNKNYKIIRKPNYAY
jgi:hypothetical protein